MSAPTHFQQARLEPSIKAVMLRNGRILYLAPTAQLPVAHFLTIWTTSMRHLRKTPADRPTTFTRSAYVSQRFPTCPAISTTTAPSMPPTAWFGARTPGASTRRTTTTLGAPTSASRFPLDLALAPG